MVAPEGTRTTHPGQPMCERQIHAGGSIDLAMATGVPVVPIYIHGNAGILDRQIDKYQPWKSMHLFHGTLLKDLHRRQITVSFGEPIRIVMNGNHNGHDDNSKSTDHAVRDVAIQRLKQQFIAMSGEV